MPFDLAPNTVVEVEPPLVPVLEMSPPAAPELAVSALPSSVVEVTLPGIPELVMGAFPASEVMVLPMAGPPGPAGSVGTHTHNYIDLLGVIPQAALPEITLTNFLGTVVSQAAMLALSGQRGDWCTRTDLGTDWQLIAEPSSVIESWRQSSYPVSSVAGKTGAVALVKGDVGLGNVNNTADSDKPVSTAQAAADALAVPKATLTTKGDLFVATGSGVVGRFPVGTDGLVLLADSAQASGVRWGSAATGGVPDATASVKGVVQLAGDLSGSAANPTVPGLASKVDTSDSRLTNSRTPSGAAGGALSGTYPSPAISSELVDPAANTAGLRTLGTGSQQACAGDDTRLTNARSPTSHTHAESDVSSLVFDLNARVLTSRVITAGTGLSGGGDLSVDRTVAIADGGVGGTQIAAAIKDPAAATAGLRTLGTGSTQAAAGNHTHSYVPLSTVTTKGDIYVATASGTVARLGAGSDNQILVADSSQSTGLRWTTTIVRDTSWQTLPLSNSWASDATRLARIRLLPDGSVQMKGMLSKAGTPSSGETWVNALSAAYRPSHTWSFLTPTPGRANTTGQVVEIRSDGTCVIYDMAAASGVMALDVIHYSVL